jgi:hypothetical protein
MSSPNYTVNQLDETIIIKLSEPYQNVDMVMNYVDEVIGEDSLNNFTKYFIYEVCENKIFT